MDDSMVDLEPFDRYVLAECPSNNVFVSSSDYSSHWGPLRSTVSSIVCQESRGIEHGTLSSTYTLGDLQVLSLTGALTMELWFLRPLDTLQTLVQIGNHMNTNDEEIGCGRFDIQVTATPSSIVVAYADGDVARSCRILSLPIDSSVNALLLSWSQAWTSVHLNGQLVAHVETQGAWQSWSSSAYLKVSALYQIAFYDGVLSNRQALAMYRKGPFLVEPKVLLVADPVRIEAPQDIGHAVTVVLTSRNVSKHSLELSMQLVDQPRFGRLTIDGQPLTVEDRWPLPANTSSLKVEYTLDSDDYFNAPRVAHIEPETFAYTVVGEMLGFNGTRLEYQSLPASVDVVIVHVNHPPTLTIDSNASVVLLDPLDHNLDRVRVDVEARAGRLTLNARARDLADFGCATRSYSAWQCTGDGVANRRMTFVAYPIDLAAILNDWQYQPLSNSDDIIVVRVSDGEGGDCLDAAEHEAYMDGMGHVYRTLHRGCYQVQVEIAVPAVGGNGTRSNDSGWFGLPNADLNNFGLADFLFWLLILTVGFVGALCCCACCPRCLARGRTVDVDDGADEMDLSSNQAPELPQRDEEAL